MPPENQYSLNNVLHKYGEIQCGHKHNSSVLTAGDIRDQEICEFYIQTKQQQQQQNYKQLPVKTEQQINIELGR